MTAVRVERVERVERERVERERERERQQQDQRRLRLQHEPAVLVHELPLPLQDLQDHGVQEEQHPQQRH